VAVDEALHLGDEGAELVTCCASLIGVELGRDLVEFVDQPTALVCVSVPPAISVSTSSMSDAI